MLQLVITRSPDPFLASIMSIRERIFYDTPYDQRYWNGGVHRLLSAGEIRRSHASDPTSHFALGLTKSGKVRAYARFSLETDLAQLLGEQIVSQGALKAAVMHIIAAHPELQGRDIVWQLEDRRVRGGIGPVMYEEIVKFCSMRGSHVLSADVYVHPVPNLPSLSLHKNLGFLTLGGQRGMPTRVRAGKPRIKVRFVRLIKVVKGGWNLQRLPDDRLKLVPPACSGLGDLSCG